MGKAKPPDISGAISAAEAYGMAEFKKRTGWAEHAIRSAKKKGLRVVHVGGRSFVRGADFIDFLASQTAPDAIRHAIPE